MLRQLLLAGVLAGLLFLALVLAASPEPSTWQAALGRYGCIAGLAALGILALWLSRDSGKPKPDQQDDEPPDDFPRLRSG